ncbi:hypothetical protein [Tumebacillus flagellatus]|nr:hypothetical protein [Tumebacillus flagellatus]
MSKKIKMILLASVFAAVAAVGFFSLDTQPASASSGVCPYDNDIDCLDY